MAIEDIAERLEAMNLPELREKALVDIRSGKKTKRQQGVKMLRAIEGMQRSGVAPRELIIRRVPVIPPAFRPYTMAGDTFVPGDANELYSDLVKSVQLHKEAEKTFGAGNALDSARYVRSAVRAAYGYQESPNPKIKSRGVSGLMTKILGSGPKTSFVQSKLLAKPQDFVGRGVISPDPDLTMDELGLPEEMAWELFDAHLRRAMASRGIPMAKAMVAIKERQPQARQVLEQVMRTQPVVYSRAPAWHRHSVLSGYAKMTEGSNIKISPLTSAGLGADFDGDTMAAHVPALPEAVKDAREKLLPSNMLFSIRNRDMTLPVPKHEMLLGLAAPQLAPSGVTYNFQNKEQALAAINSGQVKLQDQVEIPDV
jgi:DNA-directed RNA polymerase beta' subunit